MMLSGRVLSVTDFGAFVDVGVGRAGLVHVSQMTEQLEPGDTGTFLCVSIDIQNDRLGLSSRVPSPG